MRPLVAALLLVLLVPAAMPLTQAQTGYVNVTFRFGGGTDTESNLSCTVIVPAGANGLEVVRAAWRQTCIHQYTLDGGSGNTRLVCLDGLCNAGAASWQQYNNGVWVAARLESFSAAEDAVLGVAYGTAQPPAALPDPGSYTGAVARFLPPEGQVAYYTDTDDDGFPNEVYVWTFYGGNANPDTWYAAYDMKWDVDDGSIRHPLDNTRYIDVPGVDPDVPPGILP